MKLKFTLRRPQGAVDLLAILDRTVSVGALAERIALSDPSVSFDATGGTLHVEGGHPRTLDASSTLAESGLGAGSVVSLQVAGSRGSVPTPARVERLLVTVVGGPDVGREFRLPAGTAFIGRDPECEICLSDPLVSRQHAKLIVSESVEIVDLGSANGVSIGGALVPRAVVRQDEVVEVGETLLATRVLRGDAAASVGDGYVDFNRSPRLAPRFAGRAFDVPDAPSLPQRRRIPMIPLLAPLLLGGVLFAVTGTYASLIFVALSPVMMVGNALEALIFGRREYRRELALYREDLRTLSDEAETTRSEERRIRLSENPATAEVVDAAMTLSPLLWTRRPEHQEFLELRLGLGAQASRSTFEVNRNREADRGIVDEAFAVARSFAAVDDVPVVERLMDVGAIGVAGPRDAALRVARALVAQVTALHSPAEVVVAAVASSASGGDWEWLKWLPHTSSPRSPLGDAQLAASPGDAAALIESLEAFANERSASTSEELPLPAVVVLVDDPAAGWSDLVAQAERATSAGLGFIFVAPAVESLPAVCRTYVEVAGDGRQSTAGFVRTAVAVHPVVLEELGADTTTAFGRRLAAVQDVGADLEDESDLPLSVPLLSLIGQDVALASDAVIDRWIESNSLLSGPRAPAIKRRPGTLRAVLGQGVVDPLTLDLRTHGPHALVGGTTGSGKSELLQSWILSLAASYSPQRVTFLLVDYKGGSAFRECKELPHTVGLVTDLTPHLVQRTLTSLNAELRYRERLLSTKRAKDLVELERAGDAEAPPSLVIVVDEFAALVQEVPEFVDGVVNVGQRGRSLGLHLILATQRPAGVIKGSLRTNTNLRIALRVADVEDSMDVIDSPLAAGFEGSAPGRAVAKTGPGRLMLFQSAYVGGATATAAPPPQIALRELRFGRGSEWEVPEEHEETLREPPRADITRLVSTLRDAACAAEVPEPRRPWLDELETTYDLSSLIMSRRSDAALPFGLIDDPAEQEQRPVFFEPDRDGNIAVFGTGGSGKSAFLRTLAVSAAVTRHGGPCWVYGLDFGARGLHMLERLPNVGAVIDGEDHERIARLLRMLRETIDERAARFAAAGSGTLTQYRARESGAEDARILVLLDGVAAFRQGYEVGERNRWFEMLLSVAADGRPVGVHFAITSDRAASIPSALGSSLQRRLVLRMADDNDYGLLGLPSGILTPSSPPGRGLIDGHEVQVAVLGGASDVSAEAHHLADLAASMAGRDESEAPPIKRLASALTFRDLPDSVETRPVLGLESDELAPIAFEPRGAFVVAGPPGSGRSTALCSIVEALRRVDPKLRIYYFGNPRSPVAGLEYWKASALTPERAGELAAELTKSLLEAANARSTVVVVEGIADFVNTPADLPLQDALKRALDHGAFVVAEGETSSLIGSYPLHQLAKSYRTGIVLQPDQVDGSALFRVNFPRVSRADFPVGRGLYVTNGVARIVQLPMPDGL